MLQEKIDERRKLVGNQFHIDVEIMVLVHGAHQIELFVTNDVY